MNRITGLRSLASLQPRYCTEESVAAIAALGGARSAAILGPLRMRTLLLRRLAPLADGNPVVAECVAALRPRAEAIRHMHAVLDANLDLLRTAAEELGLELYAGKGLAARVMYDDPSVRDFGDLDLFVRTRDDATRLATFLRQRHGYAYQLTELPWLKLDRTAGLLYGQVALAAPGPVGPDGSGLINVDIHFGDYSVRHASRLGLTSSLAGRPPGLHLIPPEENLACVVNNAAGDHFVTAKDCNDLLSALSLPQFDVERFTARLRQAHLVGFFGFIISSLRAATLLTDAQEARLRSMPRARTAEPAPRTDRPDWGRRCRAVTCHAFAAARPHGVRAALRTAVSAYRYYRRPLRLRADDTPEPPIVFNADTCVRLVPLPVAEALRPPGSPAPTTPALLHPPSVVAGDRGVERFDTDAGTVVRIAAEHFAATVEYRVPQALVAVAGRLSNAAAGPSGA